MNPPIQTVDAEGLYAYWQSKTPNDTPLNLHGWSAKRLCDWATELEERFDENAFVIYPAHLVPEVVGRRAAWIVLLYAKTLVRATQLSEHGEIVEVEALYKVLTQLYHMLPPALRPAAWTPYNK